VKELLKSDRVGHSYPKNRSGTFFWDTVQYYTVNYPVQ